MKKKTAIVLVILITGVAAAYYFYFRKRKESDAVSLTTAKAGYGYIAKSVTATGTIQPVDTVSVGSQVSGVVKNVYADFNDVVRQGQLLARVDASIINAQLDQVKAALANAQSNLEYQQNNYERQSQLYTLGAISKVDYQVALNQYNMAKAAVAGAAAQKKLGERNLYYTSIYSPINGVVLNRNISEGQTIASSFNAPTLFVIAKDLTKMQVRAAVNEADIGGVRKGQAASFTVDAFPDDVFEGHVQDILLHPSVSANVVTYITLIDVDNSSMKLKPGMTASINIFTEKDTNALLIPARAVNFIPDATLLKKYSMQKAERPVPKAGRPDSHAAVQDTTGKQGMKEAPKVSFVWVRKADTLVEKKIITGMNDDSYIKVISGLSPGDEVITGIATGSNGSADKTQRSPFMPQMSRPSQGRQATNTRNP